MNATVLVYDLYQYMERRSVMIQMSLEFELERAEIPLEYERVFVSFLKEEIRDTSYP